MADNVDITPGSGATVAADLVSGVLHQRVKLSLGADGVAADAPVGAGTEAGVLRVTIANDSTGLVSVDDNGATLSVDDGAGSLTVDGTVTAELSATDNAVLDAIALAVATEGDALGDGVLMQGDDGTDRTNVLVDTAGHVQVDVQSAPDAVVTGKAARDAAVTSLPVLAAGTARALAGTTPPTAVSADADTVDLLASREGVQYVHPHGAYVLSGFHNETTETHAHVEVIPAVNGLKFYVTDIIFSTDTDATTLFLVTDTAGAATPITGTMYFKSGGGAAVPLTTPIPGTVSKNIGFTTGTTHTGSITISGYYAP